MLIRIKKVNYLSEYKLNIAFSDGKTKTVDFENWIREGKGYLKSLKDIEYFKKVEIDDCHYTICWPNGADFCPDVLYEIGTSVEPQTKRSKQKSKITKSVIRRRKHKQKV